MQQLDLFGGATEIATPAATGPAAVQLALFRPDLRAVRAPHQRAAAAAVLDPALHDDTLI
jgi:hypothetical protein